MPRPRAHDIDPHRRSFVDVAPDSHFPIQNLPHGIFTPRTGGPPRAGVAIGEEVLDLAVLDRAGALDGTGGEGRGLFDAPVLNGFLESGPDVWRAVRARIADLLDAGTPELRDDPRLRSEALVASANVAMALPVDIGDYTDFYSSRQHATNVGTMFRGAANALMDNWLHLPVGYHGRASSIVVDGTPIRRPNGQTRPDDAEPPVFGPSRQLDFELEVGFLIGRGNALGQPIPVERALDHVFGLVLVNDWSARDIQRWEYVPLGPFLSKSFATSISPWVVPLAALGAFFVDGPAQDDPRPLPYLDGGPDSDAHLGLDLALEVTLSSARMREADPDAELRISATNARHLYWSMAQQIAHHTVGGCNLRVGDLLASGTISGPSRPESGSLLERTWRGTEPIDLPDGDVRRFLEDGDELTLSGFCQAEGFRIGFGRVRGRIEPA